MTINDFSTPRRMSAGAFVVLFVKSLKELVGAVFIAIVFMIIKSGEDGSMSRTLVKIVMALVILIVVSLAIAFIRYYFRKFHIAGDKLIFTHGLMSKRTTSIPLSRVHSLRTNRGFFYRIFDLRGVSFDTLASEEAEVELILDETDWQKLLEHVNSGEAIGRKSDSDIPPPFDSGGVTRKISNYNIIKAAICQNHLKGFTILGAVLLAVIDKIDQFDDDVKNRIIDYIDSSVGDVLPTTWQWICFFAAVYLIVMILWTGKIALRYGDMTLTTTGEKLTIESGLISRFTCRFARDKVSVLSIKRNPLEALAGCQTIALHQANNASGDKKEGDIRIFGSMLGEQLLSWWLDDDNVTMNLMTAKSGIGLFVRKFIPNLILALVAVIVIAHFSHSWLTAVVIGGVYVIISVIRSLLARKHSSITLADPYVVVNCGNIANIQQYIKYRDIESVGIRSTPFTSFTHRVSLSIATNAEAVTVYSLKDSEALRFRNFILNKAVSSRL